MVAMLRTLPRCATKATATKALLGAGFGNFRRLLSTVPVSQGEPDLDVFREQAFEANYPVHIEHCQGDVLPPAINSWFTTARSEKMQTPSSTGLTSSHPAPGFAKGNKLEGQTGFSPDFSQAFEDISFPYELTLPNQFFSYHYSSRSCPEEWIQAHPLYRFLNSPRLSRRHPHLRSLVLSHLDQVRHKPNHEPSSVRFLQFEAPMSLLKAALRFNHNLPETAQPLQGLYIAQASWDHVGWLLRQTIESQLETPNLVRHAGKGDVYNANLWMGLESTYTPWHRDPNPNYFIQMVGAKRVRLMAPQKGQALLFETLSRLGISSNPRIRGAEMMEGRERQALEEAVWGLNAPQDMFEVVLRPCDRLFIPKGWWHSLKSVGSAGDLNASVNWWFR